MKFKSHYGFFRAGLDGGKNLCRIGWIGCAIWLVALKGIVKFQFISYLGNPIKSHNKKRLQFLNGAVHFRSRGSLLSRLVLDHKLLFKFLDWLDLICCLQSKIFKADANRNQCKTSNFEQNDCEIWPMFVRSFFCLWRALQKTGNLIYLGMYTTMKNILEFCGWEKSRIENF